MDQDEITDMLKAASDQISANTITEWSGNGWTITVMDGNFLYTYNDQTMAVTPSVWTNQVPREDISLVVGTLWAV